MKVTAEKLLDFYKDKSAEGKYVNKYMENHDPTGQYAGVIETFLRLQGLKPGRTPYGENAEFYRWLKCKFEKGGLESFQTLHFLSNSSGIKENKCDILLQNGEESATQKWHLYVSWAAMKEYWAENDCKKPGYDPKARVTFSCPELLLWMCEAAESEKIECFYNKLLDIKAGDPKDVSKRTEWVRDICEEIGRIINRGES